MATGNSSEDTTPSQLIITNNFPELIRIIDLKSLYSYLVKYDMLTEDLKQQCLLPNIIDLQKKRLILTALSGSQQPNSLKNLIKCLRESARDNPGLDEHSRIAQKLENELNIANNAERHVTRNEVPNPPPRSITVGQPVPEGNDGNEADPPQQGIWTEEDHHEGEDGERQALLQPPNGPGEPGVVAPKWFNKRLCKWGCYIAIVCYPIAVILCLLCFIPAGVVTWNDTKDLRTTYSVSVSDNQTVLLPLHPNIDDRFVHSLSLQLIAPDCRGGTCNCESQISVVPCSNLSKTYTPGVSLASHFFKHYQGQFYLLNGSTIHISYKTLGHSDPASIWIFKNATKAGTSSSDKPQCSDSRYSEYGKCKSLTEDETVTFNVTSNSFYFIRCFQEFEGNCLYSDRVSWSIDVYWYNFSQYADSNRTDVTIQNVTTNQKTTIALRKVFDPVHYGTDPDICILIHKYCTTGCEETVYAYVSDTTKVEDAWLFTSLVAALVVITFGVLAVAVHIGCWVSMAKKQQPAPV